MDESLQKVKGRLCFRAPVTKDEKGDIAIFQEMSSRPTTIVDTNLNIAYGCLDGNKTTCADAVRAYVQSDLKSKHRTFVRIPRELWRPEWYKNNMRHPMCLLVSAVWTSRSWCPLGTTSHRRAKATWWFARRRTPILFLVPKTTIVNDCLCR